MRGPLPVLANARFRATLKSTGGLKQWAKAHFFIGRNLFLLSNMSRQLIAAKIETIAEEVTASAGIELVEVEFKGTGRNHLLRVYVDKPEGVTHEDCQRISDLMGEKLDAGNIIDGQYTLEISSPGVERKLKKAKDFERFIGQPVKIFLKEPLEGKKMFEGSLKAFADQIVMLDVSGQGDVAIPFERIDRANLKFHW